jgi:hypothetical protein
VSKSALKARGSTQEQADEAWLKMVDTFLAEAAPGIPKPAEPEPNRME